MRRTIAVVALLGSLVAPGPLLAFGGGGGDGNGAFKIVLALYPSIDREVAGQIYRWLYEMDEEQIRQLSKAEGVCERMACNGLSGREVTDLADAVLSDKNRRFMEGVSLLGAVAAALSAVMAFSALVLSVGSDRRSRRQEARLTEISQVGLQEGRL